MTPRARFQDGLQPPVNLHSGLQDKFFNLVDNRAYHAGEYVHRRGKEKERISRRLLLPLALLFFLPWLDFPKFDALEGEQMASVNAKLLLGWMEEAEAMNWLLREYRGDNPFNEATARELWQEYQARVAALPPRACVPPACIAGRKHNEQYEENCFLAKFSKDPTIVRVVKLDDPGKLVIHQLVIVLPKSEGYLPAMQDERKRVRTCLGRGLNFTGVHPQARRDGNRLIKPVPHAEFVVTSVGRQDFALRELNRHISVKEYNGRMLLAAGYHRVYISMYRKVPEDTVLPLFAAVETDADGFFSVASKLPFKRDLVLGPRPPLLSDFFDETLCIRLPLRKCRVEIYVDTVTRQWDRSWLDSE